MHHRPSRVLVSFLFLLCAPASYTLEGASLLADLSSQPAPRSGFDASVVSGGRLFLAGASPGVGTELHTSDGTLEGTQLVIDLMPGARDSGITALQALGDGVIFRATDPTGPALFVSDGTPKGTRRIAPNPQQRDLTVGDYRVIDNCLWFSGTDDAHGEELWRYCNADALPALVADIVPGPASSSPSLFLAVRDRILFNTRIGLWRVQRDELEAAPFTVPDAPDLLLAPFLDTAVLDGRVFFEGITARHGEEVWTTDGTAAGTHLLADIMPGPAGSRPVGIRRYQGAVYFTAESPEHGHELRRSDGTTAGTTLAVDLFEGNGFTWVQGVVDDQLIINVTDEQLDLQIFVGDGSEDGTTPVQMPSDVDVGPVAYGAQRVGEQVVMIVQSADIGYELWRLANTDSPRLELVTDLYPGRDWGVLTTLTAFGDQWIFGGRSDTSGNELWTTRGTRQTTRLLLNLGQDSNRDSAFTVYDNGPGAVLAGPGKSGPDRGIWTSDGTPAGTRLQRSFPGDVLPDGRERPPRLEGFTDTPVGLTFSVAPVDALGATQWVVQTDTVLALAGPGLAPTTTINGVAIGRAQNAKLWRTDGTPGSMQPLVPAFDATFDRIRQFQVAQEQAFFLADTRELGRTLWYSDGTSLGTRVIPGFFDSTCDFGPRFFVGAIDNDVLLINCQSSVDLFRVSATTTTPIASLFPQYSSNGFAVLATVNLPARFVFMVYSNIGPAQLWATDGTTTGTQKIFGSALDSLSSALQPGIPEAWRDRAYFVVAGNLWQTDGTRGGTTPVRVDGKRPERILDVPLAGGRDDRLFFVGWTRGSGEEIWSFDGRRYRQETQLMPGSRSADPRALRIVNGRLVFSANDGVHGVEPWVLEHP